MTNLKRHLQAETPANLPIWREFGMGIDWLSLHYSPDYFGLGLPKGDKSAVILVPGFLADDTYLGEMYYWLKRIGYRPYMSKIGRVVDCFDSLVNRLLKTIEQAYQETGAKVHLVGHSMGGMLARAAATLNPEQVASVITLGSPFRGIRSHPLVLGIGELVRKSIKTQGKRPNQPACFTAQCGCKSMEALNSHFPENKIMNTAIYTKQDGVVDWRACVNDNPATNFEVNSTHVGLAFNPFVYRLIAQRLAQSHAKEMEIVSQESRVA